ncbi:hypothetical protein BJ165DRAFT_1409838 [Panaeolus papilionaceus]|nr:hypothetical protein BJ165DRAFT_1409838 [Panaeolus papilionaceus]
MEKITDDNAADYEPNQSKGEPEVDCDDDNNTSIGEPGETRRGGPTTCQEGRKKGIGREGVEAARLQAVVATTTTPAGKRKERDTQPQPKKPKTINTTWLLPGWKTATAPPPPTIPPPNRETQGPVDDDSMVQLSGFAADNESDKVEIASQSTTTRSLVKVTMHTSSRFTKTARPGGAKKWKLDHLEISVHADLTRTLVPLAKCMAELVDKVFPNDGFVVEADDVWCGLISYHFSNWRNSFFNDAKGAINLLVQDTMQEDPDTDITTLVNDLATPHGNPPNTLHVANSENHQTRTTSKPPGDVEHALKFWTTGAFVKDKKPSSFCSADNYVNTTKRVIGPDGRAKTVTVPVASRFKTSIESLDVKKH